MANGLEKLYGEYLRSGVWICKPRPPLKPSPSGSHYWVEVPEVERGIFVCKYCLENKVFPISYAGIIKSVGSPDKSGFSLRSNRQSASSSRQSQLPAIPNFQISDIVGGSLNAAMGILAALIRQKIPDRFAITDYIFKKPYQFYRCKMKDLWDSGNFPSSLSW